MEGVIAYVTLFGGNFAPRNWALCQGQLLPISSNTALFSLLGTMYGGNGTTTFALPNLMSRTAVGAGQGPGLSLLQIGQTGGAELVTLTNATMPAHSHVVNYVIDVPAAVNSNSNSPVNGVFAKGTEQLYSNSQDGLMKPFSPGTTIQNTGSGLPFSIVNPVLSLNYIICTSGVYPSRN